MTHGHCFGSACKKEIAEESMTSTLWIGKTNGVPQGYRTLSLSRHILVIREPVPDGVGFFIVQHCQPERIADGYKYN